MRPSPALKGASQEFDENCAKLNAMFRSPAKGGEDLGSYGFDLEPHGEVQQP